MKNAQATLLRIGALQLGRGVLEDATWREGRKGCSPVLCTEPVPLEPEYVPFDGAAIVSSFIAPTLPEGSYDESTVDASRGRCLSGSPCASRSPDSSGAGASVEEEGVRSQVLVEGPGDPDREAERVERESFGEDSVAAVEQTTPMRTLRLFSSGEDISSPGWMDTLLQGLTVIGERFSFELAGAAGRVTFRFGIPESRIEVFKLTLQGLFPAVRIVPEDRPFPAGVPSWVEELVPVAPYHRTQTLLGREGASPLGIVVASIAGLAPEDFGLFQVLLAPAEADHDWHYNIENLIEAERRGKELALLGGLASRFRYDDRVPPLLEPSAPEKVRRDVAFYAVVVRYAVWSDSRERSVVFRDGARSATGIVRFGNRQYRRLEDHVLREALGDGRLRGMVVDRMSHRQGLMVTSEEAATFVHLPNPRTLEMFGEIEQRRGLEWTAPDVPDRKGQVLGFNDFAGRMRRVSISHVNRLQHTYLVGATGSGKSNLMKTMALDDARDGFGLALVDPHGDGSLDFISRMPERRMKDLVYISFGQDGLVPRWNPFAAKAASGKVADDLTRAFLAATWTSGPRMEHILRSAGFVVHRLGGTLEDLAEMVGKTSRGEELRMRGLAEIKTPEVQRFLREELPKYGASELDPVRNKLSRLLLDESLGAMFRQRENTFDPRQWMDEGRIVLVNLASGHIGTDHARFTGALLVSLLHRAALGRADVEPERRRPFFLYLDEFQHLQSAAIEEILSEGRKYGLGVVLAHQEGGQLGGELVQALGNCGTRVVFRPAPEDAPRLRRALLGRVTDSDLLRLGTGEAYVGWGEHVASLRTELCGYPVLRNGRSTADAYARAHYAQATDGAAPAPRQKRQYDSLGEEDKR